MTAEQYIKEMEATRLNFRDYKDLLFDEFGNHKKAYEIVRYEKYSDKKWYEVKRYDTLGHCGGFVINDKIYFRVDDALIPMNMDSESETCGVYEHIVKEIPITHKITNNEVLEQFKWYDEAYKVCKQSYSDAQPFYTIQDSRGQFKVNHASHNLLELIETAIKYFKDEGIKQKLLAM